MKHESQLQIAVLASGTGSNLQAILDEIAAGKLPVTIATVISDVARARALERARESGVRVQVLAPGDYADRGSWDSALTAATLAAGVELVVLAGFMRILGTEMLTAFRGRILNIHPSLLPKYPGLDTYSRALAAGDREVGTSVHFVTEELDGGPLIAQARVAVGPQDNQTTLRERVQHQEHRLYPRVVGWFADGRLVMRDGYAWLDGEKLLEPVNLTTGAGSDQVRGRVTPV